MFESFDTADPSWLDKHKPDYAMKLIQYTASPSSAKKNSIALPLRGEGDRQLPSSDRRRGGSHMSAPENATTPTQRWILAITSMASFIVVLDTQVVTTALTRIRLDLGASLEALEWTVNAYTLTFAVLILAGAALGDRLGRARVFVAGIALFVASSVACAVAPSVVWLIAARACQGAGAALVMPLAMAILGINFPGPQRAKALGAFAGITGLATICGPVVGGGVAEGLSWHWIFWINVPVGAVLILLARSRIPRDADDADWPKGFDLGGNILAAAASFGIVWGLVHGRAAGWTSQQVWRPMMTGAALLLAWIAWEARVPNPMIPLRFFRSRAFSVANAVSFLFNATLYGTLFFMAQFLQTALGFGSLGAGWRLLPWTATLFIVAPLAAAKVVTFGERPLVVTGLGLQATGLAWIAHVASPSSGYAQLVLPMIVAGAGVSMAMPATQNAVLGTVAPHEIGKASGTYNTLRFLGGVVGVSLSAALFDRFGGFESPEAFSEGFRAAIGLAAAISAMAAGVGMLLPSKASLHLALRGE
jgi:EmrB/QacA subfamily drug resistance transporter